MATLWYSQVRAHPSGTIHYIANEDKLISETVRDVGVVLNYMGEPESTERVFSFGQHCSSNPDLAEKQMELYRARYFASKKGAVQGLKEGEEELLGLHFFLSYTVADSPTEVIMNEISFKIAKHLLFKDFAVFSANHFDKEHRHTHFFVCAYSADGKPRKLNMQKNDFDEIRRYINKLCVEEYGLSVIDLKRLRYNNPEYSAWIDNVIAEGKVTVHPEKEERKKWNKQKISTQQLYYRGMKAREERAMEEYQLMTDQQRQKKDFMEKYYCIPDNEGSIRWYVSGDPEQRIYVVPRIDRDGNKRTRLELIVRFILLVADHEGQYIGRTDPETWFQYHAKVDTKLQGFYDYMATAKKINITQPEQIAGRILDIGKQMNALKQEKVRHEESIEKQERIVAAYDTYSRIRHKVEGVQEPEPETVAEYKEAYAVLACNQVLTDEAYKMLCERYEYEKRKVTDYETRLPELKRQYHDLKRLEALAIYPARILHEIYSHSSRAHDRATDRDIDSVIGDAIARTAKGSKGIEQEKEY